MAKTAQYRFESFLYPAHVSRIELEKGEAEWVYIRRQAHKLADERKEQVMLYVYNDHYHRWDYTGKALPGGEWYDFNGHGPYELSADGRNYFRKGGEK